MLELQYSLNYIQNIFFSIESSLLIYETILNNLPIILVITDQNGNILSANRLAEEYFTTSIENILGKKIDDLIHKNLKMRFRSFLDQKIQNTNNISFDSYFDKVAKNPIYWQVCKFSPSSTNTTAINLFLGTNTKDLQSDIEYEILKLSHLTTVGTLAAGVSHELNNPLTIIQGFVSRIERSSNGNFVNEIDKINNHIERIKNIVQKLKLFSLDMKGIEFSYVDLEHVIQDVLNIVKDQIVDSNINVLTNIEAMRPIMGNNAHLSTLIHALISNAIDALNEIPSERILTIQTNQSVKGRTTIVIRDNGCGMDQKTKERIFDPFFTTKPVGKATGLGMSIAFNIIKVHNGLINISSKKGEGTTVTVTLPGKRKIP